MFGLGFGEVAIILVVALLVFGPEKLPEIARTIGRTIGELRRTMDEIRYEVSKPSYELKKELQEVLDLNPSVSQAEKSTNRAIEQTTDPNQLSLTEKNTSGEQVETTLKVEQEVEK